MPITTTNEGLTVVDGHTIEGNGRTGLNICIDSYTKGSETSITLKLQVQFSDVSNEEFYDLYTYASGAAPTVISTVFTSSVTSPLSYKINSLVFPDGISKKFRIVADFGVVDPGDEGTMTLNVYPEKAPAGRNTDVI